ncbi:type II secretion system F family protein [Burkholderiaceae bacterium FT117]|uniref:type II secretion system F family protein n=1 Tax=Zeimonas sediminis TaxID=2944268 RepID=UPI002342E703|nr:type II secretion system F family protein [Zeimonas sediminis]MCM5572014.1 type II secretion system F family protein [Zeimonas sediminis]
MSVYAIPSTWFEWLDAGLAIPGAEFRLWLSLAAAFVAASLAGSALVRVAPRRSAGPRGPRDPLPPLWRLAWPMIRLLEGPAAATIGAQARLALEERLQQAGFSRMLSPAQHRAACWLAALWGASIGLAASIGPAGPLGGAVIGMLLPITRLRDRAAARQRALLRQLPFYLDLVTMSVEAGLNLGASLAQAVDRGPPGPMRDELAQLLRDLRAGRSRDEALRAMAARVRLSAVSNLVAALATAQKQGVSLGPILRAQAEQRRTERFLRAEKLAMEAPVKMLMPLVLFIFPGTFAVLLFPVVSRLIAEGVL